MTSKGRSGDGIERKQCITRYTLIKMSNHFSIKSQVDRQRAREEDCELKEDKVQCHKQFGR